jgi:hypothetical protein
MKVLPKKSNKSANGWLSYQNPSVVLSIQYAKNIGAQFLIWSDIQEIVALFPANEFIIVESSVPRSWIVSMDANSCPVLSPEDWLEPGFWEDYHSDKSSALAIFERVASVLIEESSV